MKDYQSATFPQATYKGGIYGIPDGLNTLAFIYNKKLFAEAGITTPPATWSQLLTDSKKLVSQGEGFDVRCRRVFRSDGLRFDLAVPPVDLPARA